MSIPIYMSSIVIAIRISVSVQKLRLLVLITWYYWRCDATILSKTGLVWRSTLLKIVLFYWYHKFKSIKGLFGLLEFYLITANLVVRYKFEEKVVEHADKGFRLIDFKPSLFIYVFLRNYALKASSGWILLNTESTYKTCISCVHSRLIQIYDSLSLLLLVFIQTIWSLNCFCQR